MFAFTARAAVAAACARTAAIFTRIIGNRDFRIFRRLFFRRLFVFHRAGIMVFTARMIHFAIAVFTAVSHSAARIFFAGRSRVAVIFHRAGMRRFICRFDAVVGIDRRDESENEHRRKRDD